ncbi:hypothetical protein [Sulfobacillus thermosulfidooxidans]|uniref:hypothetical protein n=1 Tax=Sulfobacillus thermosulfidooxidans TaxID=28034 RepID=UPI0006B53F80|nr:hypothetical protein [Sulfobacillus thermosulfidooxidans]
MIPIKSDGVRVLRVINAQRVVSPWARELWVVLAEIVNPHPYVTWEWNPSTQSLSHGHYFVILDEARKDFDQRIAAFAGFPS